MALAGLGGKHCADVRHKAFQMVPEIRWLRLHLILLSWIVYIKTLKYKTILLITTNLCVMFNAVCNKLKIVESSVRMYRNRFLMFLLK